MNIWMENNNNYHYAIHLGVKTRQWRLFLPKNYYYYFYRYYHYMIHEHLINFFLGIRSTWKSGAQNHSVSLSHVDSLSSPNHQWIDSSFIILIIIIIEHPHHWTSSSSCNHPHHRFALILGSLNQFPVPNPSKKNTSFFRQTPSSLISSHLNSLSNGYLSTTLGQQNDTTYRHN